ncbi:hypothetical protein DEO72_LG2g3396 [Vigna unguiculata]|uniref:Uncharacterized protein n=1 Tax=Vigna unguiculata TaxID=3917 RepID=A0A4D6L3H0_VIGUN|nr:hypothetical protein DEO72_LG2g3396 [Vigna unguiculata]
MLDVESRRVVDVLERLPTKVPGKWVVCCYLTDNSTRYLCGVMAHHAKKVGGEVDLFAKIRDNLENGVGKYRKRLCVLAKIGGVSSSGSSNPDLGGFEKNKVKMRKGVEIKVSDEEVVVVEAADRGLVMRALSKYLAQGLVLGRRVTTMLSEELSEGDKKKLAEEVVGLKVQRERD